MESQPSLILPRQNLTVLAICIVIVLGVALALLGPAVYRNLALDQEIIAEQYRLNILEQANLIQQQLDQQAGLLAAQNLPAPGKPEALTPEQLGQILGALQNLARGNAVEALTISPQLEGLDGDSKSMRIMASFLGPLPNLHALVTQILLLPYVEDLRSLNFAAEHDTLRLNLIFQVRNELPTNRPAPSEQGEPVL